MSVSKPVDRAMTAGADLTDGLARAAPHSKGVDSQAIMAFLDDVEAAGLELHSFMLHRAGAVVADGWWWPYRADRAHVTHSLTKSFTGTAVGLALAEGLIRMDDKVVSYFPEHLPPLVSENLAAMTIEDLLTMRTGHADETSGSVWRGIETSWVAEFFNIPVVHRPGEKFVYTSAASYMLSAILTKASGQTLHAYLRPRLLEPMGIFGETWDIGTDGFNPGGNGLTARTADMLKLGILYAQKGVWNGTRLLSERWVEDATRNHCGAQHNGSGYGYHWMVTPQGDYCALGVFVQMTMVFPGQDAVIAITAAIDGSRKLFPILYRHFPAGFKQMSLPPTATDMLLKSRLDALAQPKHLAGAPSPLQAQISGMTWSAQENPQGVQAVRFDFTGATCVFHLFDADGDHVITMGLRDYVESRASMPGSDLHHGYVMKDAPVVGGARWLDDETLEMTWIFAQSAFRDTVTCHFSGLTVTIERRVNVNSGVTRYPVLTAVAAA